MDDGTTFHGDPAIWYQCEHALQSIDNAFSGDIARSGDIACSGTPDW